jgi:putative ABC transport system permease protein
MPEWKPEILRRLAPLRLSPGREAEIAEEIEQHLDDRYQELLAAGYSADSASRVALDELKGEDLLARNLRPVESDLYREPIALGKASSNLFAGILQDIHYAFRMMRKSPGFTVVAVLTLALGIGANTAIFSVLDAVLLKSLPYADPQRLVLVWGVETKDHSDRSQVSATDVMDWRKQNDVFEDIATYGNWTPALTGQGEARRVPAMLVGDGYFQIMRAKPILGRTFTTEENSDGKDHELVLSYGFWQSDMGGDPNIIGKSLILNGDSHTIVGVLPADFRSLPLSLLTGPPARIYRPVGENYDNKNRSSRHLRAVARLKPDVTVRQAQADMSLIAGRLSKQYPADNTNYAARVVAMKEDLVSGLRPALLVLFGAVSFVLLIACANVANLLLARGAIRQREVAVRAALGASQGRILRQFLAESVLLALAGGGAGILLAESATGGIAALGREAFPALNGISLNLSVLLFTLVMALLTSVVFGLAPAERAARLNVSGTLKDGTRSLGAAGESRLRDLLVVFEMGLALVLAVAAGLMIRSVVTLYNLDPGFAPGHLIAMDMALSSTRHPTPESHLTFNEVMLRRVQALPGVESAATTTVLPLSGNFDGRRIIIYDKPRPDGDLYSVDYYCVSPNYFHTMRIPLREGRYFTDDDRVSTARVVIVSESMARTIWPGEDPIGKRIKSPGQDEIEKQPWSTVVGVVGDVKQWALDRPGTVQLYGDESQVQFGYWTLVARTKTAPAQFGGAIQGVIHSLDPDEAASDITTMDAIIASSIAVRRLAMSLLACFAGLALLLACVGVYGVMSYSVEQRRREIGVRLALGAQPSDVLRLSLGHGARLAVTGLVIGVGVALVVTRLMSSLLFRVSASDPATFASVSILLIVVAIAACYIPARRAMRVDPMVALRYE